MPTLFKAVDCHIKGIKCDACTWRDDTVEFKDFKQYLNKQCPVCGRSLLTPYDYAVCKNAILLHRIVNIIAFPGHIIRYMFSKSYRKNTYTTKIELQGRE